MGFFERNSTDGNCGTRYVLEIHGGLGYLAIQSRKYLAAGIVEPVFPDAERDQSKLDPFVETVRVALY